MEDPQNSEKLSDGGARLKSGDEGRKPRRRRSRRGRKKGAAGASVQSGGPSEPHAESAAAAENTAIKGRKRKRRRGKKRDHNGEQTPQQALPDGAQPPPQNHAGRPDGLSMDDKNQPSAATRKNKRRRRKKAHAAGPLGHDGCKRAAADQTQLKPAQTDAPAPSAVSSQVDAQKTRTPQFGRSVRSHENNNGLYAALDLGTNNCRLLIAQPTRNNQFRVIDGFSRIVRLGEGLAATGSLSPAAMDRAVEALSMCASKLKGRGVKRMRLIATEACRAADNGEDFLARVRRETGLKLEIINRETEAKLAVSSCASLIGRETRAAVLFDIGGGSSEIAVIRLGEKRSARIANHISHWTSLPVGVVTLSERYGGHDVTPDVFESMVSEVEALLADFRCPDIEKNASESGFHLIGTSGTVTTLAGVHLNLPRYDRRKVDGIWLSNAEVTAMQDKLLSWDFAGRAANPCIGPDRADLVLAGCAILEAIRRRWPAPRMRVADRGLREGILTDMMMRDGVWRKHRRRNTTTRQSGHNSTNNRDG